MRIAGGLLSTALLALLFAGCDPERVAEEEAKLAAAKAKADSAMAVAAAAMDSAAATAALDSTTVELDSGIWNIEEPPDIDLDPEEMPDKELTYEKWRHVSDDTFAVDRRRFDEAAIDKYLADPDLDYDRTLHHDDLWWSRFMRWLGRKLNDIFGSKAGNAVFDNLHWIMLGIAVIVVLWFLRRHLFAGVFGLGPKQARLVTEIEENIEELDLDALLREAEKSRDWRMALRYQWLKVLRKLVDDGRIKWQPRFTDADYLSQLKEPALRATFSELSFLFKWVWYGDAPMDAERYQRMRPAFEAAHRPSSAKSVAQTSPATPVPNA